ncbi:MAG: acetylglutamate kinase [Bacteroidota bacterium]
MISTHDKTEILIAALPYIQRYEGKTFVIKYGGAAMVDDTLKASFARDVTLLKSIGIRIVIVHGGGKEITAIAEKLGVPTRFVNGQRYTDAAMMEIAQMVLAGKTNKDIVACINCSGGQAVGLCGIDAGLLTVRKLQDDGVDLGNVGTVTNVNHTFINLLLNNNIMPVIAPIGVDDSGEKYNINADVAAAGIAGAIRAEKLVYLSDVDGIHANGELIHSIGLEEAHDLIGDGTINNGMIPKTRSAFNALKAGVKKVHMIDGRVPHALLLEIFTNEGIGTELISAPQFSMEGTPS